MLKFEILLAAVIIAFVILFFDHSMAALAVALIAVSQIDVREAAVAGGGATAENSLVAYTRGEFRAIGGFTTLGESVCRAAIYLQTAETYGLPLLLMPHTGDWLQYQGVDLELDGLDEKHKLAFEYDGPQHYSIEEWRKMGHSRGRGGDRSILDFYRARFYDRLKTRLCREHGIKLIRISTWTNFDAMRDVVRFALAGDFDEHRPVDDSDAINSLTEVDRDDSSLYPRIHWNHGTPVSLTLATARWMPHPFDSAGEYRRAFDRDLKMFCSRIESDLVTILPRGALPVAELQSRMREVIADIAHLVYTPQFAETAAALDEMSERVARQLN